MSDVPPSCTRLGDGQPSRTSAAISHPFARAAWQMERSWWYRCRVTSPHLWIAGVEAPADLVLIAFGEVFDSVAEQPARSCGLIGLFGSEHGDGGTEVGVLIRR
jgi:hypothetical protein